MLPNESPLQLVERPSGCRLLDKLAVDRVLVELVQIERVRPGEIAIGHLLVGELVLVNFLMRVRSTVVEHVGRRQAAVPNELQIGGGVRLAVLLVQKLHRHSTVRLRQNLNQKVRLAIWQQQEISDGRIQLGCGLVGGIET